MKPGLQKREPDAVFIGWQNTTNVPGKPTQVALYNVLRPGPHQHSTLTAQTLRKLGLKVPTKED